MPLNVPKNLPAVDLLKKEHIFVMDSLRASHQDIRPLRVLALNLMPLKITTETDLIRLLSNTPLQIELEFMKIKGHTPKNTPIEHLREFYKDFDRLADSCYDGLIVTGAPVEQLPFTQVAYWEELAGILDWARKHVTSTFYICWAAQAALYRFYGVPKYDLPGKCSGVFSHTLHQPHLPIFRGFDQEFYVPHSRYTEIRREDIAANEDLTLLSESPEAGVYMVMSRGGREFYITGHSEYAPDTLDKEYQRDRQKGLNVPQPRNYYRNNNPSHPPLVRWKAHANLLFTNWLNYYVYQETPYRIEDIRHLTEIAAPL
ncbi:MAG: homoserine O-succinyltransferase [Tannerellaceae bacterium]|jgi:homoserine O-succinyltransferase|nr:homoserine O-succinyltransferase [Tannerellaceae bacterium]